MNNFILQPSSDGNQFERVSSFPSVDDFQKKFAETKIQEEVLIKSEDKELSDSKETFNKNHEKLTKSSSAFSFFLYSAQRMTNITLKSIPGTRIEQFQFFGKIFLQALTISVMVYAIFKFSFVENNKKLIEILMKRDQRNRIKLSLIEKAMFEIDHRVFGFGEKSLSADAKLKNSVVNSQITDHHTQTDGNEMKINLLSDEA